MNGTKNDAPHAHSAAARDALALLARGRAAEAERELAALAAAPWGTGPDDVRLRVHVLDGLGRARFALRDTEGGLAALRLAVDMLTTAAHGHSSEDSKATATESDGTAFPQLRCRALQNLCFALSETGATEESVTVGEEAVRLAEAAFGPQSPDLAGALLRLSTAIYRRRDLPAAEALIRRAMSIWEAQPGHSPQEVGACLNNLGRIHEELGDLAAGIAFHRQAVAFRRTLPNREDLAFSLGNLGTALAQDGQWHEACAALGESLELYAALGKGDGPEARSHAQNLAVCRHALNPPETTGDTHA